MEDVEKLEQALAQLHGADNSFGPTVAYLGAAVAAVGAAGELAPVGDSPDAYHYQLKLLTLAEQLVMAGCDAIADRDDMPPDIGRAVQAASAVQDYVDQFMAALVRPQAPGRAGR